jgi:trimethylamine--corrinoid protein Co-methyltransferase
MANSHIVQPHITVLDPAQVEFIHEQSLRILSSVGVRVDSERARDVFAQALGSSSVEGNRAIDGDRVRIPRDLVEWALETAPSTVEIYDRRGNPAFRLGDDRTRFGIGVTSLYYQDPQTDEVMPFERKHMETMVRLGSALRNFDVISTVGIVQDVPTEVSDLYAVLEMSANTVKPLVILVSDEDCFPSVLNLLEHLHGDLASRPFVIPYFNPVTPLIMNAGTADKMLVAIERGLPFIYSTYSMSGMSTPITPAGTLALMNAELLAGLVLSQLAKEGTPIILGILPAIFDMKTMVSFYDPQSLVLNLVCAEMMAHYRLPHCGTSGSGTGWGPDLLAAGTYWMNHVSSCMGKAGLAPFVGDTLGSKAFSPANVVFVHEVIEQALRFAQGIRLDDASVDLDEIGRVGPGGDFLLSELTLELYRSAYYSSPIFPRWSLEKWQEQGRPQAIDLLRSYTRQLMAKLDAPEDHAHLMAQGEAFIESTVRDQR